jgi:hypothetical protein
VSEPPGLGADEPLGLGVEEPEDRNGAFPPLGAEQRARLRALGEVRAVASGEVLFREGDEGYDFFVVAPAPRERLSTPQADAIRLARARAERTTRASVSMS